MNDQVVEQKSETGSLQKDQVPSETSIELVNAEEAEAEVERSSSGPFGWLPKIFRKK